MKINGFVTEFKWIISFEFWFRYTGGQLHRDENLFRYECVESNALVRRMRGFSNLNASSSFVSHIKCFWLNINVNLFHFWSNEMCVAWHSNDWNQHISIKTGLSNVTNSLLVYARMNDLKLQLSGGFYVPCKSSVTWGPFFNDSLCSELPMAPRFLTSTVYSELYTPPFPQSPRFSYTIIMACHTWPDHLHLNGGRHIYGQPLNKQAFIGLMQRNLISSSQRFSITGVPR